MNKIFLCLSAFFPLAASFTNISGNQYTNEYGTYCMGQRRPGINIYDLLYEDDLIRKFNYPTHCCDDYYIRFTHSSIPTLATSSFGTRPNNVVDIILTNTNISKILPGTFTGLNYLYCLDLSQNNIDVVPYGIFNGLKRLYILNLANNNIKQIFNNAFDNVPLRTIFLQNNVLSFLDDDLLSSLKNSVTRINLSNNILKDINNTFVGMNSLISLNLDHNYIDHVNFANIYSTEIYLRNNCISHISSVRNMTQIIDSSEKNIQTIEDLGSGFINSSIAILYLSRNAIQLNHNSLIGLYHLTHLYLDNNKIRNISNIVFRNLKSLIFLDISHNDITQFQYGTFDHMSNVRYLKISFNKLTELQLHIFSSMQELTELDFGNNQINDLDTESFLYHCSTLRKINVDGNLWNCKALTNIIKYCQTKNVEVVRGNSIVVDNVRGIACDFAANNNTTRNNVNENKGFDFRFLKNSSEKSDIFDYLENSHSRKPTDAINLNSTFFYNFSNSIENLLLLNHEISETHFIFGVSLMVILVFILIVMLTILIVLLKKGSYKSTGNISHHENVELL